MEESVRRRDLRNGALAQVALERTSTSDQVASTLRQAILGGDLAPGMPLREASVAASLDVSRNTVREAIKLLARERLVTHQAHRGVRVARLTSDDVGDIYQVRRVLETQAIRTAARAGAERLGLLIDQLDASLEDLRKAVDADDYGAMTEADVAFHRALVSFLGSRRIDAFFEGIQAEFGLAISMIDQTYDDPMSLIPEHKELRDLLAAGRLLECQERLVEHLDSADRIARRLVREQEDPRSRVGS